MKNLLKLSDLTPDEIEGLLDLAADLKRAHADGSETPRLRGKVLGMVFTKPSTRTRLSFETAMLHLGGHAIFLSDHDSQIARGEPPRDTARVMSRYLDAITIRTFRQEDVEEFAAYATVPVINALTDYAHPCQVLADLLTVRERKGKLRDLKLCYIGAGSNVANSLIVGAIKTGMTVSVATPDEYPPDAGVEAFAHASQRYTRGCDPAAAAENADVLYTDVWTSMGEESERAARMKALSPFSLTSDIVEMASRDVIVLHCLPAHRGEEIEESVLERFAPVIFDEAENRLHAQKAVLLTAIG